MKLSPELNARVMRSLDAVVVAAGEAQRAPDLDGSKRALNRVWFAVHEAQEAIRAADEETRALALAANDRHLTLTMDALYGEQA